MSHRRIPVLYIAPWIDFGGADKGTIDWFRWLDRSRFAPSLVTTQRSPNRRLREVIPYADEVWALPDLFAGERFPRFISEFIVSREIPLVHIMHSRLGFDLLPDLRALPVPLKIVVQLHVEDGKTYVRYVTTRYGNLVDGFSVSSEHLGRAVEGYGVARDRIHVIPTGVDAEGEFSPERVTPLPGLAPDVVHILFIGRLVDQKDPLTMVEVARELELRELEYELHVVGDGPLKERVRAVASEYGLSRRLRFEPPTRDVGPWYRAADLVLMTSVFEGVPYVVYEAMAMRVPVVAPALPGTAELMGGVGGTLVSPRASPQEYANAMEPLIRNRTLRESVGAEGRARVLDGYNVRDMADGHARLYDRLLGPDQGQGVSSGSSSDKPVGAAISFCTRPRRGTPPVSVVTPCYNDGRWLRECVGSVRAQDYPSLEMIVVDNGSTEGETLSYLDELRLSGEVRVVRIDPNRGPSQARNRGIQESNGRYILPLDADNVLVPGAVERFVAALQAAGEKVGYIYPTLQHFGNREDYFEPPAFNPWLLAQQNFIETTSLFDREVFDCGLRYREDVVLGAEDWDFFLTLAEREIRGAPARAESVRYRNHGFSRSLLIGAARPESEAEIRDRHIGAARAAKSRWAPALSVIALAPVEFDSDAWAAVANALTRQHLRDAELLVSINEEPRISEDGPQIRNVPTWRGSSVAQRLGEALERTAAPHVVMTYGTGIELLGDPGSLERLVRLFEQGATAGVIGLADGGKRASHPWCTLAGDCSQLSPHSVAVSARGLDLDALPASLDDGDPLGDLCRWLQIRRHPIQWRHLSIVSAPSAHPAGWRRRRPPVPKARPEATERRLRRNVDTILPGAPVRLARWDQLPTWMPPFTHLLVRHRRPGQEEWTVTRGAASPPGFEIDRFLGLLHWNSLPGTARITTDPRWGYTAIAPGEAPDAREMEATLGYAEQVQLPELEALLLCRHPQTGSPVLVCGDDDPLRPIVQWPALATLGWIERSPIYPCWPPGAVETTGWLRGVVRTLDRSAWRHRIAIGSTPVIEPGWELGALLDRDPGGGIPVWLDTIGRVNTPHYVARASPLSPKRTVRWVLAPVGRRDHGPAARRLRAIARRGAEVVRVALAPQADGNTAAAEGWLLAEPGPGRLPLYVAVHPVTSDQLVTRDPSEPRELGYESMRMLGYALAVAPVTGTLKRPRMAVPWASRDGDVGSHSEDPLAGEADVGG